MREASRRIISTRLLSGRAPSEPEQTKQGTRRVVGMNAKTYAQLLGAWADGAKELAEIGAQAVAAYLAITGNGVADVVEGINLCRSGQAGEHGANQAIAFGFAHLPQAGIGALLLLFGPIGFGSGALEEEQIEGCEGVGFEAHGD
jgi:hypothetical protein